MEADFRWAGGGFDRGSGGGSVGCEGYLRGYGRVGYSLQSFFGRRSLQVDGWRADVEQRGIEGHAADQPYGGGSAERRGCVCGRFGACLRAK
jgi:hypothetical protein